MGQKTEDQHRTLITVRRAVLDVHSPCGQRQVRTPDGHCFRCNSRPKWEDVEMGPAMMQGGGMMRDGGPVFAAWHVAATCDACHTEFREED